ncbi:MAG: hypothetical protein ACE5GX_00280 [Thermoanaerobaculia bacterium]
MTTPRSCVTFLACVLATVALIGSAAEREPDIAIDGEGHLIVTSLPPILQGDEVKRHVNSGLTTSLLFQVKSSTSMMPGAARVDIRLELWDEIYLVTVIDGGGRVEKAEYESQEALAEWWSEAELVLSTSAEAVRPGARARVSLAVIPFSQAELVDTQKWLTESIGQSQGSASGRRGNASRAVSALIATSMQRRPVRSWSWNLAAGRRQTP